MCDCEIINFFDTYFICGENKTSRRYTNFNDVLFAINIMKATVQNQIVNNIADENFKETTSAWVDKMA